MELLVYNDGLSIRKFSDIYRRDLFLLLINKTYIFLHHMTGYDLESPHSIPLPALPELGDRPSFLNFVISRILRF
jgi:hypothetical protein